MSEAAAPDNRKRAAVLSHIRESTRRSPDTNKRKHILYPWITGEAYAVLRHEAEARRMPIDDLATKMLEKIAEDDLFRAVLDTDE